MEICYRCGQPIEDTDNTMYIEDEGQIVHEECFIDWKAEKLGLVKE